MVYVPKEVKVVEKVNQRIGDSVDNLFNMFEKNKKRLIKELIFAVLFYQARYKKFFRENLRSKRKFLKKKIRRGNKEKITSRLFQKIASNSWKTYQKNCRAQYKNI